MNLSKRKEISRRRFIKQASCASVGSTALYSTLLNLTLANRAVAQGNPGDEDYKALVCLFMAGGNDSYNMLVPRENDEYGIYQSVRGDLALTPEQVFDVNGGEGRKFGIHSSMPEIRDLYNAGELAFLCNAGTLVEPTNLDDYENGRVKLPLGLFSHSDQIMHWQSSTPDNRSSVGWAGRAADLIHSVNGNDKVSMNISINGMNIMQSGNNVSPYVINDDGAINLDFYDNEDLPFFRSGVDSLLEQEYQSMLKTAYADLHKQSIDASTQFNDAIEQGTSFATEFPESQYGDQLNMVARSIAARSPLDMKRQTFFVFQWGWDHHDEVLQSQETMLAEVSKAVGAFWTAVGELGIQNKVTLFTASDFGRTLSSNGQGSDHAWGGNHFVLGGGINGGRMYGDYPNDLSQDNPLDTGRGRLIPTTSVDEYFAELALWLGVQKSDLPQVLPNLDRFYSMNSSENPIGMFG